jgi:hypothetical protein
MGGLGVGVFAFCQAAAIRAQSDEKNGEDLLVLYPKDLEWTLTKFRNAATNWRLALRFDEAARVENRIKGLDKFDPDAYLAEKEKENANRSAVKKLPSADFGFVPDSTPLPSPKKYISTDPNAGEDPIPRARPVKKSMFDDLIPARTATPGR